VEDVTELTSGVAPPKAPVVWSVKNKIDLDQRIKDKIVTQEFEFSNMSFYISSLDEFGFTSLMEQLGKYAVGYFGSEPALVSRERQRKLLEAADRALQTALEEGLQGREDIIAEELRVAANALGRLTGRIDVEDILDVIFRDFCIGK
jgi:tRNA modification GTPase